MNQSRQKSYVDVRRRDLKFDDNDWVCLKIPPMNQRLLPNLYKILRRIGKVDYEHQLTNEFASLHPVFHVSLLKKCIVDPKTIVPLEYLGVINNSFL